MALRCFLQAKLHRVTITEANVNYKGSVGICPELLEASGLKPNEQVDVYNVHNGNRLTSYILQSEPGHITLNGAAALLGAAGQEVIIAAYTWLSEEEIEKHDPTVVLVDSKNRIETVKKG